MEISVKIPRQTVFRQVARRMEWQGTRAPEDRDYDRLSLSESDKALFHSFFDEAAMHAIDICRQMLKSVSNTDEQLKLQLSISDSADSLQLSTAIENMMTAHIVGLWQEIVSPQRSGATFSRRDDYALKLQSILYHHHAPRRGTNKD